jgi:magnesium transporter
LHDLRQIVESMFLKSDHLNAIMKTLTLVSVIFIFIAGMYRMNFEYMPELKSEYFYSLILMFGIGIGTAFYFRKKRLVG